MKGLNTNFYRLFLALFVFFVLVSIPIWNIMITKGEHVETSEMRWFIYSTYLLVLFGIFVLLSHFELKGSFIHLICLLWCLLTPIVLFLNHAELPHYVLVLLWPVVFEMSYLSILAFPRRLNSIYNSYWVIFLWGVFLFLTSKAIGYAMISPNSVYAPLLTMPILMIKNTSKFRLVMLIVFSLLALFSMKRSSMLIIAAVWVAYGFLLFKMKNKVVAIIAVGALIVCGVYLFVRMNVAMEGKIIERIEREETDDGKNRLAIWQVTWAMIQQSSVTEKLIGHGHYGVRNDSILEVSAHNDILEVIYDYGLIVFVLYLGLWFYLLKRWWYLRKVQSNFLLPYTISLSIFVVMSLVSHLILYTSYFNFLVMFWGCSEAMIMNREKFFAIKR